MKNGQIAIDALMATMFVLIALSTFTTFVDKSASQARGTIDLIACNLAAQKITYAEELLSKSNVGHPPANRSFDLGGGVRVDLNYGPGGEVNVTVNYLGGSVNCGGWTLP